jgi:hypothetical protein
MQFQVYDSDGNHETFIGSSDYELLDTGVLAVHPEHESFAGIYYAQGNWTRLIVLTESGAEHSH